MEIKDSKAAIKTTIPSNIVSIAYELPINPSIINIDLYSAFGQSAIASAQTLGFDQAIDLVSNYTSTDPKIFKIATKTALATTLTCFLSWNKYDNKYQLLVTSSISAGVGEVIKLSFSRYPILGQILGTILGTLVSYEIDRQFEYINNLKALKDEIKRIEQDQYEKTYISVNTENISVIKNIICTHGLNSLDQDLYVKTPSKIYEIIKKDSYNKFQEEIENRGFDKLAWSETYTPITNIYKELEKENPWLNWNQRFSVGKSSFRGLLYVGSGDKFFLLEEKEELRFPTNGSFFNSTLYADDDKGWTLTGGFGSDELNGNKYDDTLYGDLEKDIKVPLMGCTFKDTIFGNGGDDYIKGNRGDDSIKGGPGMDKIYGGIHNDTIYGDGDDDKIYGESGNDSLKGGSGNDYIDGSYGKDTIYGGADNDVILGGTEDDSLYGGSGNDYIDGYTGNDSIFGGSEHDFIWGDSGSDKLWGGSGNDTIYGNEDKDTINGGFDNDSIYGGVGNDSIEGGHGQDTIYGGDGNDYIYGGSYSDKIYGNAGKDKLYGGTGDDYAYGGDGSDKIYGYTGLDTLAGGRHNDEIYGGDNNDWIYGNAGNDKLYGEDGNDIIVGGAGRDILDAGTGDDKLYGEYDFDSYIVRKNQSASIIDIDGEGRVFYAGLELNGGKYHEFNKYNL